MSVWRANSGKFYSLQKAQQLWLALRQLWFFATIVNIAKIVITINFTVC